MKAFLLSTLAAVCLMLISVDSFSIPDCSVGCDPKSCPTLKDCKCGTYLDYCECCSYCLKCPGDECSLVANDQCANGTVCRPPKGATGIMTINGPGWCT